MIIKRSCKYIFLFLFVLASHLGFGQEKSIDVVDFDGLTKILSEQQSDIVVVNFWATWCAPCVAELPFFEALTKKYDAKDLKVVLVSLDFPKSLNKKLYPFLEKNKLQSEVLVLHDRHMNEWINKVDSTWTGAIPATLVLEGKNKKFHEGKFENIEEIERFIYTKNK